MKNKVFLIYIIFMVILAYPCWSAVEDLDEIVNRKSMQASSTFYSGEDTSNHFIWQPMSLCYIDVTTGHEVWRMTSTKDISGGGNVYFCDMNGGIWSADGKRMAFYSYGLTTSAFDKGEAARLWYLVDTDASLLRPIINGPTRSQWDSVQPFFHWSPILPDTYYEIGDPAAGNTSVSYNILYKAVVSDADISISPWITLPTDHGSRFAMDQGISSTGTKALIHQYSEDWLYVATIYPDGEKGLNIPNGYTSNRPHSTYWGNTPTTIDGWHGHGLSLLGDGTWFTGLPSGSSVHWKFKTNGSATDGGSIYIHDTTYPYFFGGEAEPINTVTNAGTGNDPWCDAPSSAGYDCMQYQSHGAYDRWGTKVIYSNVEASPIGAAVYNLNTHTFDVNTFGVAPSYHDWHAWSDYCITQSGTARTVMQRYNEPGSVQTIVYNHTGYNGGTWSSPYVNKADPVQSPDGTKIGWNSEFLNNSADSNDIFWVVAYYPHPPEITSVSASSETVTIKFDWRNTTGAPSDTRGYTQRGWPDEDSNNPPPPRETDKFRLWRSTDKFTWVPIGTTDADIFSRYDFSDGTWGGNTYWNITDAPGNGTFYYAVTSIEWSGLESQTLSNVYKITVSDGSCSGSQDTGYPADPGGDSNFYTTAPDEPIGVSSAHKESPATADGQYTIKWTRPANYTMIRYYNIYAEDGAISAIEQQNRIASIPAGAGPNGSFSWVDWLGKPNGTTQYVVTSVDYQGNESGVASVDDDESPTIPLNLTATTISSSAIDLSWEASTDNVGVAGYRIYRDGNYLGASSSTQYSNTGLTPSMEYSYRVSAYDARGNESAQSSSASATTESEPSGDEEAPTVPGSLSATATSSTQIDLSWDASTDNLGVHGYRIYRDGNEVGSSSSTQYSDTGLTPSTTYTYGVSAYDAAVNESGQSSPVSATTHESGSSGTISVIDAGDPWKYLKGGSDPGSGWNNVFFDHSFWLEGPTGIGFGDGDDATVLSDMQNNYLTVYTRKTFQLTDTSSITAMTLNIDYDDGFVAYINGHEVARSNISGTPSYDSPASGWNEAGTPVVFDLTVYRNILLPGTNVLAIEVHNAEISSSDLSMIPSLTVDTTSLSPPVNSSPTINSFTAIPSGLNNPGASTTFNVSATDPDGDALTYTISFGDGTANGSGSQVVHTYAAEETYTATVTVDDGNGHSVGQSLQVPVDDISPAEPENVSSN